MKNTDKITHVGYTVGGKTPKGRMNTKVRFISNKNNYVLRTKELSKSGAKQIFFIALPEPMTKFEAVCYLNSNVKIEDVVVQDAVKYALKRLNKSSL